MTNFIGCGFEEPTQENLSALQNFLNYSRSELRTLVKHGLSSDPQTDETRKEIAALTGAIAVMKTKLSGKNNA